MYVWLVYWNDWEYRAVVAVRSSEEAAVNLCDVLNFLDVEPYTVNPYDVEGPFWIDADPSGLPLTGRLQHPEIRARQVPER